jgi:hypothetical protein
MSAIVKDEETATQLIADDDGENIDMSPSLNGVFSGLKFNVAGTRCLCLCLSLFVLCDCKHY